jgi:hypothetical protein
MITAEATEVHEHPESYWTIQNNDLGLFQEHKDNKSVTKHLEFNLADRFTTGTP